MHPLAFLWRSLIEKNVALQKIIIIITNMNMFLISINKYKGKNNNLILSSFLFGICVIGLIYSL